MQPAPLLAFLSLALGLHLGSGVLLISSDPVADACSPLCAEESSIEVQCARKHGCYHPDVKNDTELYSDCLTNCWSLAGQCFDLCSNQFDPILRQCYTKCSGSTNPDCITDCFSDIFAEIKAKTLNYTIELPKKNNSTIELDPYGAINVTTSKQKATTSTTAYYTTTENITGNTIHETSSTTNFAAVNTTLATTLASIMNPTSDNITSDNTMKLNNTAYISTNGSRVLQPQGKVNTSSFYPLEPPGVGESVVSRLEGVMQFIWNDEDEQTIVSHAQESSNAASHTTQPSKGARRVANPSLRQKELSYEAARDQFLKSQATSGRRLDSQWDKRVWARILADYRLSGAPPTKAPTQPPSTPPTKGPTKVPTKAPTESPTTKP